MTTPNATDRLAADGPLPATAFPGGASPAERRAGVQRFNIDGSPGNGHPVGTPTTIYYLAGEHPPKAVIRTWLLVNDHQREHVDDRALHWRFARYGEAWKAASRELLGPFESLAGHGGDHTTDWACPFDGCEFEGTSMDRARHLEGHA